MLNIWAVIFLSASSQSIEPQQPSTKETIEEKTKRISVRNAPACVCDDEELTDITYIDGLVIDAKVLLGKDNRTVEGRMATIFKVRTSGKNYSTQTIWHTQKKAECGVTFDYGKYYKIPVRETEDGMLNTDQCLIDKAKKLDAAH